MESEKSVGAANAAYQRTNRPTNQRIPSRCLTPKSGKRKAESVIETRLVLSSRPKCVARSGEISGLGRDFSIQLRFQSK